MTALLDRIPWTVVWRADARLNGRRVLSRGLRDYTQRRAARPEMERLAKR